MFNYVRIFKNNENSQSMYDPKVGDRFSFSGSYVDVHFDSDPTGQYSGFSFSVMDGYEPNNDISNLGYASRVINKEDFPEKEAKKTE